MSKDNVVDFDKEQRKQEFKEKVKSKLQDGRDWLYRNKDLVITYTPVAIGAATVIAKAVGKNINLRKQEHLGELRCYDRSAGHYWPLRRKLSTDEWLYIERRRMNGERLGDILSDLRVLK